GVAAEAKHHAVFVFIDDPDPGNEQDQQDSQGDAQSGQTHSASTWTVSPSTDLTTTRLPSAIGCSDTARHRSPKTKTVPPSGPTAVRAVPFCPTIPRSAPCCGI